MWPQATEFSISVLWLPVFKNGDSSASLGHSEKCVHVISLSKGAAMRAILEVNTRFFQAFRTPLFSLTNLHLFHYHLQYPDSSVIFSFPNPHAVSMQQFWNSSGLSWSICNSTHFCPLTSVSLLLAFLASTLFPLSKCPIYLWFLSPVDLQACRAPQHLHVFSQLFGCTQSTPPIPFSHGLASPSHTLSHFSMLLFTSRIFSHFSQSKWLPCHCFIMSTSKALPWTLQWSTKKRWHNP